MMSGATGYAGSVSRAVQLAIVAGNDIVESSTTPQFSEAFWTANLERMRTSPEFRVCVADAARRVLLAKLAYFKDKASVPIHPDIAKVETLVPDPEGQAFFLSQAARSVTLVRDADFPWSPKAGEKVLLAANFPEFFKAGLTRFPGADTAPVDRNLYRMAKRYDTVVFCLSSQDGAEILQDVVWTDARVIVISALSPVLLTKVPQVRTALAVYSYSPSSFRAAFSALAGDYSPKGVMPLRGIQ
jgi:beta-N-acetylhexosaminidase